MQLIVKPDKTTYVQVKDQQIGLREFVIGQRERRNISASAIAFKIGISYQQYHNWEIGTSTSPMAGLMALEALGFGLFILGDGK